MSFAYVIDVPAHRSEREAFTAGECAAMNVFDELKKAHRGEVIRVDLAPRFGVAVPTDQADILRGSLPSAEASTRARVGAASRDCGAASPHVTKRNAP